MSLTLLLLAALIALNAIFAMSELAIMTSRQSRLQQAARRGSRGAAAAIGLAREPTRFLSTVQVGITLIGILAGAIGEKQLSAGLASLVAKIPFLEEYATVISLALVVAGITYASLVFGELVPKRIALAYPETVAATIAKPLTLLSTVASIPVRLLSASTEAMLRLLRVPSTRRDDVSEDDVRALVARAATSGVFTPQEHKLFQRVMRVGDLVAKDLMVPRADIVAIDESTPLDDVRVLLGVNPFSHYPVCRDGLSEVLGVVHVKDLIAYGLLAGREFKVAVVAQEPFFVPETMPALKLLDAFRAKKTHLAFVVDEYGAIDGLVTINDVVSALLGDVSRRNDPAAPSVRRREDGSLLVEARLPLHDLAAELGWHEDVIEALPRASTTGGLVIELLGHLPHEGEKVACHGFAFEVLDMDGTRIDLVLVTKDETPHDASRDDAAAE
jgi:putative hemolysin